eukprot:m.111244 g.111244  ORF g.111244 m.111244 type:complete len:284 (-) comp13437_c0_seq5:808-1659(-)
MSFLSSWMKGQSNPKQDGDATTQDTSEGSEQKSLFGSFMTSVQTFGEKVGQKAKQVDLASVNPFAQFEQAQSDFTRQKHSRDSGACVPPWVGHDNEEEVKERVLNLSSDERNVLRDPPPGSSFEFEFHRSFPIAKAILEYDERLAELRFALVPKKISEQAFWCNYFYRVMLIEQAASVRDTPSEQVEKGSTDAETETVGESNGQPAPSSSSLSSPTQPKDDESDSENLSDADVAATGDNDEEWGDDWEHELDQELQDMAVRILLFLRFILSHVSFHIHLCVHF